MMMMMMCKWLGTTKLLEEKKKKYTHYLVFTVERIYSDWERKKKRERDKKINKTFFLINYCTFVLEDDRRKVEYGVKRGKFGDDVVDGI